MLSASKIQTAIAEGNASWCSAEALRKAPRRSHVLRAYRGGWREALEDVVPPLRRAGLLLDPA